MTTNIAMMTSIMPIRMIIIPAADPIMMYCWFRLLEVGASLPTVTVGESMSAWKKRGGGGIIITVKPPIKNTPY